METIKEIVKYNNYLNESILDFEPLELNIFIAIIDKLQSTMEVTFEAKEIIKYSDSKERSYSHFKDTINSIQNKSIKLKIGNGYKLISPFPTLDFNLENKSITVEVHRALVPLLESLKKQFTMYSLVEFLSLQSKYSKRIYQLLKQCESTGSSVFKVDELKSILKADYSRFYDLEKNVLKKSKEEINKLTSINMGYKKIKQGKRIESLEFSISKKIDSYNQKAIKEETREGIIKTFLETFGVRYIKDLSNDQKKLLNVDLNNKNFNGVR